jgi:tetratricopeptide (TPR) repeat protein
MELTIEQALQQGVAAHKDGKLQDAERLYRAILHSQPTHPDANHNLGVLAVSVKKADMALPLFKTALEANPKIEKFWLSYIDALIKEKQNEVAKQVLEQAKKQGVAGKKLAEAHNNLGNTLKELGRLDEAEASYTKAIALKPDFAEAHNNLGITLKELGRLDEAEASYTKAIALKSDFAEAHSNLGITLKELGRLDEAEASYTQAIALKPDYAVAFWNLHGIQKTIQGAEHWIDKCLIADTNHVKARLTKAALRFYQGDSNSFDGLMQSEFKQHPYMRSFSWAFSLPNLPELHFDKWYFFDAIVKKSIISKPFYEFGVWRASSFKYLIKVFKKGYGFDTFTGLPEDWDVGSHVEKKGTYTSDENVPNIKGGEFIVGKFEDTLPVFFSESRPIASVINFDADLYSSTICALNFSKSVMDKDTILIFDELIINKSWEQDEFKALNEFCSINHCSYEVIAISFFTKQVAVKLIGI